MSTSTPQLYDANADNWQREGRLLLSDFTARPRVVELLKPAGARVLDLGCGEGYTARLVLQAGAAMLRGFDSSSEMVARAHAACPPTMQERAAFRIADVVKIADSATMLDPGAAESQLGSSYFDRAMAVFLFNYLTCSEMERVMRLVRWYLAPGGWFIFTVPHPCFPYMHEGTPPFYFDTQGHNYFQGVDRTYEGQIWRRDGIPVPVRCVHKTWTNYFTALQRAGFERMPLVEELHVTDEHLAIDPDFFGPLRGQPLHVLFRVEVP